MSDSPMNHKLSVAVPEKLRKQITDCRARYQGQSAALAREWAGIKTKITSLETIERELTSRVDSLRPQLVSSDNASLEMAAAEMRLGAVRRALDEQRKVSPDAMLDITPLAMVLFHVVNHWRDSISALMLEALRPFGVETMPSPPLMKEARALRQLDYLHGQARHLRVIGTTNNGDPACMAEIFTVFDRALLGEILLAQDQAV